VGVYAPKSLRFEDAQPGSKEGSATTPRQPITMSKPSGSGSKDKPRKNGHIVKDDHSTPSTPAKGNNTFVMKHAKPNSSWEPASGNLRQGHTPVPKTQPETAGLRPLSPALSCFGMYTTWSAHAVSYIPSYDLISDFLVCKVVDRQSASGFKIRIYL